jgi:hypothetical protein
MYDLRRFFQFFVIFLFSVSFAAPSLVLAGNQKKRIVCESKDYRYEYCRIPTQGPVRLKEKISHSPCIEGKTWGYDRRGVWVDEGCSGVFVVDRERRSDGDRNGDDKDGLARFGEALANQDKSNDKNRHKRGDVPDWAIGTFRGYNPVYNTDVELTITPKGKAVGFINGVRREGYYRNNQLRFGNTTFYLDRERNGFRTTRAGNSRHQVRYHRVRQ